MPPECEAPKIRIWRENLGQVNHQRLYSLSYFSSPHSSVFLDKTKGPLCPRSLQRDLMRWVWASRPTTTPFGSGRGAILTLCDLGLSPPFSASQKIRERKEGCKRNFIQPPPLCMNVAEACRRWSLYPHLQKVWSRPAGCWTPGKGRLWP